MIRATRLNREVEYHSNQTTLQYDPRDEPRCFFAITHANSQPASPTLIDPHPLPQLLTSILQHPIYHSRGGGNRRKRNGRKKKNKQYAESQP